MASPPPPPHLALPRQRPALALPTASAPQIPTQTRKPSITSATSATSTTNLHPLRQTSFPPAFPSHPAPDSPPDSNLNFPRAGSAAYSPSASERDFSPDGDFSDGEIVSAISGPTTRLDDSSVTGGTGRGGGALAGRKRKRGEKRARGRPAKATSLSLEPEREGARTGSVSLVNGEHGRGGRGVTAGAEAEESGGEDDDDDDEDGAAGGGDGRGGRAPLYEGGQMSAAEFEADALARSRFRTYMEMLDELPLVPPRRKSGPETTQTNTQTQTQTPTKRHIPRRDGLTEHDFSLRYDTYNRARLRQQDLRRLVNQTLSQSVPSNVVTVVSSYAKMFAGVIIEEARRVQAEWEAVEEKRPDGVANEVFARLSAARRGRGVEEEVTEVKKENGETLEVKREIEGEVGIKNDSNPSDENPKAGSSDTQVSSSPHSNSNPQKQTRSQRKSNDASPEPVLRGGAQGLGPDLLECDRGPLLPDHLREALRRYKKSRAGGMVGFTGLSLEGREVAAPRMGGRRMFR